LWDGNEKRRWAVGDAIWTIGTIGWQQATPQRMNQMERREKDNSPMMKEEDGRVGISRLGQK
jgi:hypothetical protein